MTDRSPKPNEFSAKLPAAMAQIVGLTAMVPAADPGKSSTCCQYHRAYCPEEAQTMESSKRVLVTDLDNTLWDWFQAWHGSFSAMLHELVRVSGVSQDVLENEIRQVHQSRGTVEYSNLLDELPSLREALNEGLLNTDARVWPHYGSALHVLRHERRANTSLYPRVMPTLEGLKAAGVTVIAYTESLSYWTEWRIRHTGLDGVIDVLYSSPDHDLPRGMTVADLRSGSEADYGLESTRHFHIERGVLKPNPGVLLDILSSAGFRPEEAVYVGDSLMKDIAMAQGAGVLDVHAKYGEVQAMPEYDLLRRVTHWSPEDVNRERELTQGQSDVEATYTCEQGFYEVLAVMGVEGVVVDG